MKNEPWEIKIRCSGKLHRVGMNSNGRLYFPDHEKKFLETDPLCPCSSFLNNWRVRNKNLLPTKVHSFIEKINAEVKKGNKSMCCLRGKTLNERLYSYKTQKALNKTIKFMKLKKLQYNLDVCYSFREMNDTRDFANILVFSDYVLLSDLPYDWYERVYLKGLAILNSCFCADVRENFKSKKLEVRLMDFDVKSDYYCETEKKRWYQLKETKSEEKTPIMPRKRQKEVNDSFRQEDVFCNNEMHTVGVSSKGRFYFKNHPKGFLKMEGLVRKLGGRVCGCYVFFEEIVQKQKNTAKSNSIKINDIIYPVEPKDVFSSPEKLYEKHIKRIISRELNLIRPGFVGRNLSLSGEFYNARSLFIRLGLNHGVFSINQSLIDWYRNVYKKGLSRIMNCFVESIEYAPNGETYASVFALPVTRENTPLYPTKVLIKGTPGNYWFIPV